MYTTQEEMTPTIMREMNTTPMEMRSTRTGRGIVELPGKGGRGREGERERSHHSLSTHWAYVTNINDSETDRMVKKQKIELLLLLDCLFFGKQNDT